MFLTQCMINVTIKRGGLGVLKVDGRGCFCRDGVLVLELVKSEFSLNSGLGLKGEGLQIILAVCF